MNSTLRKENVEPLNIMSLSGQRNLKSFDSYSSTSIEQRKTMLAKLSNFIEDSETRKTPVEEKIPKPPTASDGQQDGGTKNLFAGADSYNCQFAFCCRCTWFRNWRAFQLISDLRESYLFLIVTMIVKETFLVLFSRFKTFNFHGCENLIVKTFFEI